MQSYNNTGGTQAAALAHTFGRDRETDYLSTDTPNLTAGEESAVLASNDYSNQQPLDYS